ncbi:MAG TPA: PadR family transcriptional regulator [Longimicrobiales bacterium]|nr:PadR family transcriptional regulator [Longimicrobiales bacterium]
MTRSSLSILPGTVEFLALGALCRGGRMHGFEVLRWIEDTSDGELLVEEGALYPALHRMEKRGWLRSEWGVSEKGRRARYYEVTARGREGFADAGREWGRYVDAVGRVVAGEGTA